MFDKYGCPVWRGVDGGNDVAAGLGWKGWPTICEARTSHYCVSWRKYEEKLVAKRDGCTEIEGKSAPRCETLNALIKSQGRHDD